MGQRVDKILTPVSDQKMIEAIQKAWTELMGSAPTKEQVALIMAQNALETGHRKSMWNNNVGNITTDGKGGYNYFDTLTTSEQISPGKWKKMNLKYRAYPTLEAGVMDYLKFLSKNSRYAEAWKNILNPDPESFSKSLKKAKYYTSDEAPYTKTLINIYEKYTGKKYVPKSGTVVPDAPKGEDNELDNILNELKNLNVKVEEKDLDKILNQFGVEFDSAPTDIQSQLDDILKLSSNKKLYNNYLPTHSFIIRLSNTDINSAIECGSILCNALDEELLSNSS